MALYASVVKCIKFVKSVSLMLTLHIPWMFILKGQLSSTMYWKREINHKTQASMGWTECKYLPILVQRKFWLWALDLFGLVANFHCLQWHQIWPLNIYVVKWTNSPWMSQEEGPLQPTGSWHLNLTYSNVQNNTIKSSWTVVNAGS